MCILGSLYSDLRKNDHWHDVYEYSVRKARDELAATVRDESQDDFRAQLQSDMGTLRLIERHGFKLRDEILSYVP